MEKKFLDLFRPTIESEKERMECLEQVVGFEKKEEANLNVKYV